MKPEFKEPERTPQGFSDTLSEESGTPTVYFSSLKAAIFLFVITIGLFFGNLLSLYLTVSGKRNLSLLAWNTSWYLDFNNEVNIPAFFSTMLLMLAAALCFLLYQHHKAYRSKNRRYWLLLSILFVFLSLDENIQIHEAIAEQIRPLLPSDLNGFIYWSWVVPYTIIVLVVGGYFLRFVLSLPQQTKRLFIISGIIFIAGALGLEFFEGYFYKRYGVDHIINKILYCIEELLEMWGIILFIYALLEHMSASGVSLAFRSSTPKTKEHSYIPTDEV